MIVLRESADGVHLALKVVPGARRERIVGELGEALKVSVSRPPEGGAANRAVIALLAAALGVAEAQLEITRGQTGQRKEVLIRGLNAAQVGQRLAATLPG